MGARVAAGAAASQAVRKARRRRGRVGWSALLALVGATGCLDAQRKPHCEAFVAAADACYARAGIEPFFAANVDCEAPLSTVAEYKCLREEYEEAECADEAEAHAAVDAASDACLGWNGGLAEDVDDDDSGKKD